MGEVIGGKHGGGKRSHIGSFRQPWRRRDKKVVGGELRRESCSGNQGMGDTELDVGILGRRRAIPGWGNDLVCYL